MPLGDSSRVVSVTPIDWNVEHHEVEIALERGRVSDVQARVRRSRLARPEGA